MFNRMYDKTKPEFDDSTATVAGIESGITTPVSEVILSPCRTALGGMHSVNSANICNIQFSKARYMGTRVFVALCKRDFIIFPFLEIVNPLFLISEISAYMTNISIGNCEKAKKCPAGGKWVQLDMAKSKTVLVLFSLIMLTLYGCSTGQDNAPPTENTEAPTTGESESESARENPTTSFIDSFIDSYNKIAETPISDLYDININDKKSEYYRTEFRLLAYKDAPAKRGSIGKSTIDIINYGTISKDSIRIYISADSYEAMKSIFEQSVLVFDGGVKEDEFQCVYDKTDTTNGISFLLRDFNGYYEKSGALYTLMVDFGKVEK